MGKLVSLKVTIIVGLIILVLILLGNYFLINSISPPHNEVSKYSIHGRVLLTDNVLGQPKFVMIYYPYYSNDLLCSNGVEIDITSINWTSNKEGEYTIFFAVPSSLKNIVVSLECPTCAMKSVNLDEIPDSVDLTWDGTYCNEIKVASGTASQIATEAQRISAAITSEMNDINKIQQKIVMPDIDETSYSIIDYGNPPFEDSLKNAYYANWFAWNARYKLSYFKLGNCLDNINSILISHNNNSCYIPDYETYQQFLSINITHSTYRDPEDFTQIKSIDDFTIIQGEINNVAQKWNNFNQEMWRCEEVYRTINNSFVMQDSYCKTNKWVKSSLFISLILTSLAIGILIGVNIWVRKK